MGQDTAIRLDSVDEATGLGWGIESSSSTDKFMNSDVTVVAEYSADDELTSISRTGASGEYDHRSGDPTELPDALRAWLNGREPISIAPPKAAPPIRAKAPKLRWSREKWLHKPTQEIVDNSDPRVPRTIDESKKVSKIWYMMGSQTNTGDGFYRRDMDTATTTAADPTYVATWHAPNDAVVELIRGNGGDAYWACVRHHQAKYGL
jgi:hypothetical protein